MSLNFFLKRTATASKRPTAASVSLGELNIDYDTNTFGLFAKNSAGTITKIGPVEVGTTAPNATPAGSAGNSRGEQWLDTTNGILKTYNGTAFVNPVPNGSTTVVGILQLTDSTSSTSTTTAATPNSVKTAYDLANAAVPKSSYTAKGVILSASAASTPTALSVGTNGQVLYANSACATGLCWGAAGGSSAATPTVAGTVFGCTPANFIAYLGCQAGQTATGGANVAVGGCALGTATTGSGNTALGAFALVNATGNNNTAVGRSAMLAATTGCGNVQVGGFNSSGTNAPVFAVTTENDRVIIGSTATTNAYVQVAWTVTSDARDKTNVTALPVGLDFVNQLNPVSFQFKESRECNTAIGPVRYGFLAQEVLEAEGEKPVIVDTEVPESLKITNDHFNAVLVKAIQELSAELNALKAEIKELKSNS